MYFKALLIVAITPLLALAQVKIDAPSEVDAFDPIVVKAIIDTNTDPNVSTMFWWRADTVKYIASANNSELHIWAKPGVHVIEVAVITTNWETHSQSLAQLRTSITVKGTIVNPPLPPTPEKVSAALIIYEKDDLTPNQAIVLNSARNSLLSKVQMLDKDAKAANSELPHPLVVKALTHIGTTPLPVVIGIAGDSSLGAVVELPSTANELVQLLNTWGVQ